MNRCHAKHFRFRPFMGAWLCAASCICCLWSCRREPAPITLFAAASTTNAVSEIAQLFEKQHGIHVALSIAASSTLAKQIERGAPASLFLSADPRWVQHLQERGRLAQDSSEALLTSELVLVAPAGPPLVLTPRRGALPQLLRHGRVALGDPTHVPVGRYGRQALNSLGWWTALAPRIVPARSTRAALAYVVRGECEWGIVYAVDALTNNGRNSRRVQVVGRFPPDSHAPIRYHLARIADEKRPTAALLQAFMVGPQGRAAFRRWGFTLLRRNSRGNVPSPLPAGSESPRGPTPNVVAQHSCPTRGPLVAPAGSLRPIPFRFSVWARGAYERCPSPDGRTP